MPEPKTKRRRVKAAPGAKDRKRAVLSIRITSELRAALEREVARKHRTEPGHRHSLSHEVELRLRASLDAPKKGKFGHTPHVQALAALVAQVVQHLDLNRPERWLTEPFFAEVLRLAIAILIREIGAKGEPIPPPDVVDRAASMREFLRSIGAEDDPAAQPTPLGVAYPIALGILDQLRTTKQPPIDHASNQHFADQFYLYPWAVKALETARQGDDQ